MTMMKNFRASSSAEQTMRESGVNSIRMVDGDQWGEEDRAERKENGDHIEEINLLRKISKQVASNIRQNIPRYEVFPVQNAGFDEAMVMEEMLRYIERISNAEDAYQTAANQQVSSGIGYWWVTYEPSKWEPNGKEIKIKRVSNRFTVYLDQNANTYTYEDGKYAFITELIPKAEFEEQYPGVEIADFESTLGDYNRDWHEEGSVRVALYFYKEPKTKTLIKIRNPITGETSVFYLEDEDVTEDTLKTQGFEIVDKEEREAEIVMWLKAVGKTILEEPREFPCEYIPIVPVLGYEENLEGERVYRALTYDAEAPQRIYNYVQSAILQRTALEPKPKFFATPAQIKNYITDYENMNRTNSPVLLYNPDPEAPGPPTRQYPPQISPALVQQAAQAAADIHATAGVGLASFGLAVRERTGAAIAEQKKSSDVTVYEFFSNFMKSMQFSGRIILSMIPRVYDNERVIRIYGDDNQPLDLTINTRAINPITLEEEEYNDLSKGRYDYMPVSTIGHLTKRLEMKQALLDIMTIAPELRIAFVEPFVEVGDFPNKQQILKDIRQAKEQFQQAAQVPEGAGRPAQNQQTIAR